MRDLSVVGAALAAHRQVDLRPTAGEHLTAGGPLQELRVLASLTANESLGAFRTIAARTDASISSLIVLEQILAIAGGVISVGLAVVLLVTARRRGAQFHSIVVGSTDLVAVFGAGGVRYVSDSVADTLGAPASQLTGDGLWSFVHPGDAAAGRAAVARGQGFEFRLRNHAGEWRHMEAKATDLRADRSIRGVVCSARDITDRVLLQEQLAQLAYHDPLTGLPNRRLFRERLDRALRNRTGSVRELAVMLLDLDGFKLLNDTLGHDAGDRLLECLAPRLAAAVRPEDTVAGLGGDEFGVLMEDVDERQAVDAAERLLGLLADPVEVGQRPVRVAASIGIVVHCCDA
ncbi:MAG TPA: diguanylate cyclase, partial [Gaiellales bacterium]|nr:diguanylate cyclase [Gaiellales bacterium]